MPRHFRRARRMSAPIVSQKVQFAIPLSYVGAGANAESLIAFGVPVGTDQVLITNVPNGAKVYNIHCQAGFVSGTGGTTGIWSFMIVKLRDGQSIGTEFATINASQWSNIGLSKIKNQVIKSFTGIVATEDAGAVNLNFNCKIPKIYQRMRDGDSIIGVFTADLAGTLQTAFRYKYYQ